MFEVEVKVRADHERVRGRLEGRGARRRGAVRQIDAYYDAPHRSFADTDEALRIRTEVPLDPAGESAVASENESEVSEADESTIPVAGESGLLEDVELSQRGDAPSIDDDRTTIRLTYKGPLVDDDSKTRRELETGVESGETAAAVLEALGFERVATVQKRRSRYAVGEYTVTLDVVDGLGAFVEVETSADQTTLVSAREGAFDVLRSLGLDPDEQLRTSYLELLLEKYNS